MVHEAIDFSSLRFAPRIGLTSSIHQYRGEWRYVLTDPSNNQTWHLNLAEARLFSAVCDGLTVADAHCTLSNQDSATTFSLDEALDLCRVLSEAGALEVLDGQDRILLSRPDSERAYQSHQPPNGGMEKLLFRKFPSSFFTAFLNRLAPCFSWITHPVAGILFAVVLLATAIRVNLHSVQAWNAMNDLFMNPSWIWLIGSGLCLKLIHELGHAIFCVRYAGKIRDGGIMMIMMAFPLPYVDASASLQLRSKWRRMMVAAGGMYMELWLGASALLLWTFSADPTWQYYLFQFAMAAMVVTVLFNANALMRFDGYFILSDWIEHPNLYDDARTEWINSCRWLFFGTAMPHSPFTVRRRLFLWTYGLLAYLWKWVICLSLIMVAINLYFGFGILLAALAVVAWIMIPFAKGVGSIWQKLHFDKSLRWAFCIRTALLTMAFLAVLQMRIPSSAAGWPAVIVPATDGELRNATAGFIKQLLVEDGSDVKKGDKLFVLQNDFLSAKREKLVLELAATRIRRRIAHREYRLAEYRTEDEQLKTLQEQLLELESQIADLTLFAPCSGRVVLAESYRQQGNWVPKGTTVLRVVDQSQLIAQFYVEQLDDTPVAESCELSFVPGDGRPVISLAADQITPHLVNSIDHRVTTLASHRIEVQQSEAGYQSSVPYRMGRSKKLTDEVIGCGTIGIVVPKKSNLTVATYLSAMIQQSIGKVRSELHW